MTRYNPFYRGTLLVLALSMAVPIATAQAEDTAGIPHEDHARFFAVKEFSGAFDTGAESGGKRDVPGNGVETYNSSIRVDARFKVAPHVDKRNGPEPVWRGKGEAHVVVSGKSKTQYKEEVIYANYSGDYVDTFNVEISNIDVEKGTYQLSIIRDLWQNQPHKGKAIETKEVRISRFGTSRHDGMRNGHSWADDGGAGFGRNSPLPRAGLVITGSMTSKNNDYLSDNSSKWTTNWTIRPIGAEFEEPLKAVAGGPYTGERGRTFNLDGWKSTGKIRSYKWTFEPADAKSPIPFTAGAMKEGKRVPVVLLAPVKATLTVSDGEKEDSETVTVNVTARDFKTPFVHRDGDTPHPVSKDPIYIKGYDMSFAGGENVCALDNYSAKNSVHVLHPNAKAGSWKDNGYLAKQVKDAGGPFDGVWYADEYALRIERQVHVNKWLLPNAKKGPVRDTPSIYQANKDLFEADAKATEKVGHTHPDEYLAAIRKHELLHSELMEKALATNDPGPKLEAFGFRDEAALKAAADKEIQTSEDVIGKATEDPLPSIGFKGKFAFPDLDSRKYIPVELGF